MNPACKKPPVGMVNQITYRHTGDRPILGPRHYSLGQAMPLPPRIRQNSASVSALPPTLQKRCDEWLAMDQEPRSRDEAQQAIDAENQEYLQERMGERLAFGGC